MSLSKLLVQVPRRWRAGVTIFHGRILAVLCFFGLVQAHLLPYG